MDARIVGTTMPVLEMILNPGETIFSESGELSWLTSSVQMKTSTQAGGGGGIGGMFKRSMGGGSLFMTEYTASDQPGMIAFAAKMPGQIFPVDVASTPDQTYMSQRHGFVCATQGVDLSFGFQQKLGAAWFGGDGFRLQKITGQGRAWIQLSGEIVTYDLRPGEVMRVHPGHVGLFQESVGFTITTVPGIKNKIFGGDGLFLAQMVGPGRIWLQSMPIAILAQALSEYQSTTGGGDTNNSGGGGGIASAVFGR